MIVDTIKGIMGGLSFRRVGAAGVFLTPQAARDSDDPLLLFVHGAFHGAWCFAFYLDYLERQGVAAAAVDLRGHGALASEGLAPTVGMRDMAADVVEICRAVGRPVVIAGHSLGAGVAGLVAGQYETRGTVLLAPTPPNGVGENCRLPTFPADALVQPPDAAQGARRFFINHKQDEVAGLCALLNAESPTWLNDRRLREVPVDRASISGPALCIAAGRDDLDLHPHGLDYATARFFDAEYHFLRRSGHCFMLEHDWQKSTDIVLGWYRRVFCMTTV